MLTRLSELESQLSQPDLFADKKRFKEVTQEHSYLSEVRDTVQKIEQIKKQQEENRALLKSETDVHFVEFVRQDLAQSEVDLEKLNKLLEDLLIPPDPNDSANIILELRAGTGGDEAALFVADCARMYKIFAEGNGWKAELLSCTPSELGGFKEYIMSLSGHNVHRLMQYESGTHRVQRVPKTEAQGRIHTSAITVAILLEPDEETEIEVLDKDLRIDTYRSSGAGGQHVNTTDSAVRITHLPTGVVVYCQEERSQHKNKDKAMRWLKAELAEQKRKAEHDARSSDRASQVGSGDRSERIRTYNFPQNRLTDHRINLTTYDLDRVMAGGLDNVTSSLVSFHRQQLLADHENGS